MRRRSTGKAYSGWRQLDCRMWTWNSCCRGRDLTHLYATKHYMPLENGWPLVGAFVFRDENYQCRVLGIHVNSELKIHAGSSPKCLEFEEFKRGVERSESARESSEQVPTKPAKRQPSGKARVM